MYTLYIEKNLMLIRNYNDNSLAYRTSESLTVLTLTWVDQATRDN